MGRRLVLLGFTVVALGSLGGPPLASAARSPEAHRAAATSPELSPVGRYRIPRTINCYYNEEHYVLSRTALTGHVKATMSSKYHHDNPGLRFQWGAVFVRYEVFDLDASRWRLAYKTEDLQKMYWTKAEPKWAKFDISSRVHQTALTKYPHKGGFRRIMRVVWFGPNKQNKAEGSITGSPDLYRPVIDGIGVSDLDFPLIEGSHACPASYRRAWFRLNVTKPPAARGVWMVYDKARQSIVLFGGADENNYAQRTTWRWGHDDGLWHQLHPANSPRARADASMAYDVSRAQGVLFGGWVDASYFGDTWLWDGQDWVKQSPTAAPSAREGAAMAYDRKRHETVLFGGADASGVLGDTWRWDGSTWTKLTPPSSPSPRSGAAMAYDVATGEIVLFGGWDGRGNLGDTWIWNGSTWIAQSPSDSPPACSFAAMMYDGNLRLNYEFSACDTHLWYWDRQYDPAPAVDNWASGLFDSSYFQPSPRSEAALVHDDAIHAMVMYGGIYQGSADHDMWILTPG